MGRFCLACGQHDAREVIDAQSQCARCGARFVVLQGMASEESRPTVKPAAAPARKGIPLWVLIAVPVGVVALLAQRAHLGSDYVNPHAAVRAAAAYPCKQALQDRARWDFEWTDGITRPVFDSMRFDEAAGIYTLAGGELKLQNGFGAWKRVRYTCDFGKASQTVLSARIESD